MKKGKIHLYSAAFARLPSAMLSSQTGPAFSTDGSRSGPSPALTDFDLCSYTGARSHTLL